MEYNQEWILIRWERGKLSSSSFAAFWIRASLSLPRAYTVDGKVLARGPSCSFSSCEVCVCGAYTSQTLCRISLSFCKSEPSPLGMEASCSWAREHKVRGHNQGKCVWLCVCALLHMHVPSFMRCTHTYLSITFISARVKHYLLYKELVRKCNRTSTCTEACQGLS